MPREISSAKGSITYIYNALGQKVEKMIIGYYSSDFDKTYYMTGGFQYKDRINNYPNSKLQFVPTAEGYYDFVKNGYVYNYTDHLGNVRLSYQDINKDGLVANSEILEESNYYPFGMKHSGYNSGNLQANYKYKYNGKELQDELGLNLYDMDMRQYDPAIARWVVQDPIVHHNTSPYSAYDNNPIYWADPSGMDGEHYNWDTGKYENDKGAEVTFGQALASQGLNEDGSEKSSDESSSSETENSNSDTSKGEIKPRGNDFKNRPRTTNVLKQLYGYVKNHPSVLSTLAEYSGYSTMEVLQQLKYNEGDMVLGIESLDWNAYDPEGITVNAKDIRLEIVNSNILETAKTNEKIQSMSFFVAVTILHEFVHAGRKANNMDKGSEKNEMGWGWELRVFGKTVTPESAHTMYKQYDWNFKK